MTFLEDISIIGNPRPESHERLREWPLNTSIHTTCIFTAPFYMVSFDKQGCTIFPVITILHFSFNHAIRILKIQEYNLALPTQHVQNSLHFSLVANLK